MKTLTKMAMAAMTVTAMAASTASADTVVVERVHYRHRPGPRFMMPLEIDLGAVGADSSRGMAEGVQGSIGVHWASLSPTPTSWDAGIGIFGAIMGAGPADNATDQMNQNNGIAYGGAYVQVGHTLAQGNSWRTWLSGRGEYLASDAFGKSNTGLGVSARLSAELYSSGAGIEPGRGLFLGSYGVGVYVEAAMRDVAPGLSAFQATTGLTLRTPMAFGR
ncbi:MAG TPA: hypothetical protein VGM88_21235 [Kofleriaceae bacterium]|jgi:hypothetical protein